METGSKRLPQHHDCSKRLGRTKCLEWLQSFQVQHTEMEGSLEVQFEASNHARTAAYLNPRGKGAVLTVVCSGDCKTGEILTFTPVSCGRHPINSTERQGRQETAALGFSSDSAPNLNTPKSKRPLEIHKNSPIAWSIASKFCTSRSMRRTKSFQQVSSGL